MERIYVVTGPTGEQLVKAKSKARAIACVMKPAAFVGRVATADDVARVVVAGGGSIIVDAEFPRISTATGGGW